MISDRHVRISLSEYVVDPEVGQRDRYQIVRHVGRRNHGHLPQRCHPHHPVEEQMAVDRKQLSRWKPRSSGSIDIITVPLAHAGQRLLPELRVEELRLQV